MAVLAEQFAVGRGSVRLLDSDTCRYFSLGATGRNGSGPAVAAMDKQT